MNSPEVVVVRRDHDGNPDVYRRPGLSGFCKVCGEEEPRYYFGTKESGSICWSDTPFCSIECWDANRGRFVVSF